MYIYIYTLYIYLLIYNNIYIYIYVYMYVYLRATAYSTDLQIKGNVIIIKQILIVPYKFNTQRLFFIEFITFGKHCSFFKRVKTN